ncbi:MAG: replicative DNA helicase [Victivallaceae bacterium]|nr:replicative DNA helicase [Victivallaceae bacterium]
MPGEIQNAQAVSAGLGVMADRPQPHDLTVERAVLSAMLREPNPCIDLAVENLGVNSQVFYSHAHRVIYDAVMEMRKVGSTQIDLVSLLHYLTVNKLLDDVGGEVFLAELYNAVATTVNLESWCAIVRGYGTLRKMIDVCASAIGRCYQLDGEVADIVGEIESDIYKVRDFEARSSIVEVKTAISNEFNTLMDILSGKVESGIPTGYPGVDAMTGGLKNGEMFVLAARPSIGKTALALNIIRNIAMPSQSPHPRKVAFFSLEMTAEQISRRLLCTEAHVSEKMFRDRSFNTADVGKLSKVVHDFSQAKIFIDPTAGITIAELRAKARRLKQMQGIDVVVIDYLQLMRADGRQDSRQQEVAEISGGIKKLAKELNIPVLVLAQLNREVDKNATGNSRPRLNHLRESGTIEQDADIVAFLHRDRDATKDLPQDEGAKAEIIVEKNRNGQTGVVNLLFFAGRMEFCEASRYGSEADPRSK